MGGGAAVVDLGAERVDLRVGRIRRGGAFDDVAGHHQVAGIQEGAGAFEDESDAAGEGDPLGRFGAARGGHQAVGFAFVPAAVVAPDRVDDEFRVVVGGAQVGLVEQVRGHLDLVQDAVERAALVHQRQRLALDRLQQLGRVVQRPRDAVRAEDREAVAGQHRLRAQRCHLAQRGGPLADPALRLLRVARVGHGPDEQVAGAEHAALRHPGPDRVLGLAARVVQLERQLADAQIEPVAEGHVRIAVLPGPGKAELRAHAGTEELSRVDRGVVPDRALIAVEVLRDRLVRVDRDRRPRLRVERLHAESVVDMVVRVDRRPQGRVRPPAAHAGVDVLRVALPARVHHHQAVAGVERVRGRDRLVIEQPVGDFVGLAVVPHAADRVRLADRVDFAVPEALAVIADVGHRIVPLQAVPVRSSARSSMSFRTGSRAGAERRLR